jgi:hypothetical protein
VSKREAGAMATVSMVVQVVGLGLTLFGSVVLLRSLFISDEEIAKLSELPIQPSRDFGHGMSRPFAVGDPGDLQRFRDLYIRKRRTERRSGRIALWFLIVGFAAQLAGVLLAASAM